MIYNYTSFKQLTGNYLIIFIILIEVKYSKSGKIAINYKNILLLLENDIFK